MHYMAAVHVKNLDTAYEEVAEQLAPFNEEYVEETDEIKGFWDWWVIGGRWSGAVTLRNLDQDKLDEFWKEFDEQKLGWIQHPEKTEAIQRKKTHELFKKFFPDYKGIIPVYRDQYKQSGEIDDVCEVKNIPANLTAYTVVANGKAFHKEEWDGKDLNATDFDGNVKNKLKKLGIKEGYIVIVDYHS